MNNPVVHPISQKYLDHLTHELPQSLLLSGAAGVGLYTIASWIASGHRLAGVVLPQNAKEQVDNEHGTISVEAIRRLYNQTRTKHTTNQVVIIDDADRMSIVAQNAFLKLLEEPGERIHFILTSHNPDNLLPTIRSRVQQLDILPITDKQTTDYLAECAITEPAMRAKFTFIAAGLPAEISRLNADPSRLDKKAEITKDARDLLQTDTYRKLLIVNKYQSDRDKTLELLDSTLSLARRSLSTKPQHSLIVQIEQLLTVRENIASNYNARLQLTGLVV